MKTGMGACQGNLIQFSKQKKTRVIAGKQKCRPGLGKSHVMSECKKKTKKTLGIEELIFLFYLPFGFGSFLLRGGLSFPWCFSSLLVSSPDTAQFL